MRRDTRRAGNANLTAPNLVECSQCHSLKEQHTVCKTCGTYDGRQVIDMDKKEKKND
jgi:large subunit ribosomal protein L32